MCNCRLISLLAVGLLVATLPVFGQGDAEVRPSVRSAPALTFDVVSIKPNKSNSSHYTLEFPPGGDGVVITNVNLYSIIRFAYDFWREDLIFGVPAWTKSEQYDIQAKVAGADVAAWRGLSDGERRLMLQAVLADSFKLKAHLEPKEISVYALVAAKDGPKMKVAKPDEVGELKSPDGKPAQGMVHTGQGQFTAQQASMADLALELSDYTGRQVIDKTGLVGRYDFTLQFAPEPGYGPEYRGQQARSAPPPEASGSSVYTAVQEQLGLRLDPAKAPVEGLVIDHVERPAEN